MLRPHLPHTWDLAMVDMRGEYKSHVLRSHDTLLIEFISPGRWFAVLMMKTMLAYLTRNYEMEWTGSQNEMNVIGDAALPPISATIRVRRRNIS